MLATDRPLAFLGRVLDRLSSFVRRKHPRPAGYGDRILHERDVVRSVLGRAWWQALVAALGQRALDFAALLLALYASGDPGDAGVSPGVVLASASDGGWGLRVVLAPDQSQGVATLGSGITVV